MVVRSGTSAAGRFSLLCVSSYPSRLATSAYFRMKRVARRLATVVYFKEFLHLAREKRVARRLATVVYFKKF